MGVTKSDVSIVRWPRCQIDGIGITAAIESQIFPVVAQEQAHLVSDGLVEALERFVRGYVRRRVAREGVARLWQRKILKELLGNRTHVLSRNDVAREWLPCVWVHKLGIG